MTNKTEGSGIGLYIAKKIIEENLNGVISVKNDLYGAVFTIECVQ
jgi:signal transduction histidine kinase